MNKNLIKELAEQAIAKYWPNGSADHEKIFENFGKFMEIHAELIVKECSKILRNGAYWSGPNGFVRDCTPAEMASSIEEHFGVE